MSEEVADGDQPGNQTFFEVGNDFNAGHIGFVIEEELEDIKRGLHSRIARIQKLIPYLTGVRHSDYQRKQAAEELFRLQTECSQLEERLQNYLAMLPDLGLSTRHITYT